MGIFPGAEIGGGLLLLAAVMGGPSGGGVEAYAYTVRDGAAAGGRLVLVRPQGTESRSLTLRGAPIRWVGPWQGFATQEGDAVYRLDLRGRRHPVYDLAPLIERVVRKAPGQGAPSWAYDVDVAPGGDRLAVLTYADWSLREVDLRTKRVRLIATGPDVARKVGQKLRLDSGSQAGLRWSPDGKWIAVAVPGTERWGEDGDESEAALIVVSRNGSTARRVGSGVPVDWIGTTRLLAAYTPEGGDWRALRVYATAGRLTASLRVQAPLLAAWDGESVRFLDRHAGGGGRTFDVVRATPELERRGRETIQGVATTLTGIPIPLP